MRSIKALAVSPFPPLRNSVRIRRYCASIIKLSYHIFVVIIKCCRLNLRRHLVYRMVGIAQLLGMFVD